MSKQAKKTRLKETEAFAKAKHIRSSAYKLNLVAELIRGKPAGRALVELEFSKRRIANDVRKVLESAIANAENNHSLDVDRLFVKEATVGRAFVLKRFHTRGRGRSAGIEKPYSSLTIVVGEREEGEKKVAKKDNAKKDTAKTKAKTGTGKAQKTKSEEK